MINPSNSFAIFHDIKQTKAMKTKKKAESSKVREIPNPSYSLLYNPQSL